jgi:hypothetical protein
VAEVVTAAKTIGTVTRGGRFWRIAWVLPFLVPVTLVVLVLAGKL